jgi:hypothetical protein
MALKKFNPTSPGQRGLVLIDRSSLHKGRPVKMLTEGLKKTGGRTRATPPRAALVAVTSACIASSISSAARGTSLRPSNASSMTPIVRLSSRW